MLLQKDSLCHINSITHEGKVLVFGTDKDGKVHYTVRQDGFEEKYKNTQVLDWEDWRLLPFPNEDKPDESVEKKEKNELTTEKDQPLLRSRYQTENETAIAPVQLVSGLGHLYVFRQSKTNTLLVDRFVLDGMTNQLMPKYEVRFKRSRQKYEPLQSSKGQNQEAIDNLDFQDANGKYFYEPTQELSFVNNLHQGWFSVVLVPTSEHDQYRWHIFAYNRSTQQVEAISLRASEEGLFEFKDYTFMELDQNDVPQPRTVPGIIRQGIEIGAKLTNGLSATFYYTQKSSTQKDSTGISKAVFLKEAAKVMLVMSTDRGHAAAIQFSVAQDGTLSQIGNRSGGEALRKTAEAVLLPLDTLDNIKALGRNSLPQGNITAIARSETAQQVNVASGSSGTSIKIGTEVKLEGTTDYNGSYKIRAIDANSFEVNVDQNRQSMGRWEVLPDEETLDFDGIITKFEQLPDGKLRVFCPSHNLEPDAEVQITGTGHYNGIYPVIKSEAQHFTLDTQWQPGEVVNLKVQSLKRRGVTLSSSDQITFPTLKLKTPSDRTTFEETLSAWVYPVLSNEGSQFILGRDDQSVKLTIEAGQLKLSYKLKNNTDNSVSVSCPVEKDKWVHCAGMISYSKEKAILTLCKNGEEVRKLEIPTPTPYTDKEPWSTNFVIGKTQIVNGFQGKIAEVQLWQRSRSPQEIKDTMHLLLTGREQDLIGYWRLGAIDTERRVSDFSVHGNEGLVSGDAYVSAVTLDRTLKGGSSDAQKYSNSELFAVTQLATYEEQFEFKLISTVPLNPNRIEGQQTPAFQLNPWGQRSRSLKQQIPIKDVTQNPFVEIPGSGGWYRASARFTIPNDVTMLRSFEIDAIKGNWQQLEIRKHQIQLVSNTITEDRYGYTPTKLETLGNATQELEARLLRLTALEQRETMLSVELRKLQEKIDLAQSQDLGNRMNALRDRIRNQLTPELTNLENRYQAELKNPLNYWCRLVCRSRDGGAARIYTQSKQLIHGYDSGIQNDLVFGNYQFSFQFAEEIDGKQFYTIVTSYENRVLDLPTQGDSTVYGNTNSHKGTNQQWQVVLEPGGRYYQIYSRWDNRILALSQQKDSFAVIGDASKNGGSHQQWFLKIITESDRTTFSPPATDTVAIAENARNLKRGELAQANQELTRLTELQTVGVAQKEKWNIRKDELKGLIGRTQTNIGSEKTAFLRDIGTAKEQIMPSIDTDDRRLATTGGFLGFVRPQSRLSAIDSCTGHVQLTYLDDQGRIRQTRCDATSDQWIPDALRTCLEFSQDNSVLSLQHPEKQPAGIPISDRWTIEAWFVYPLPEKVWNTLAGNAGFQIAALDGKNLGIRMDDFLNKGCNLEQLSPGWHHIAAVCTSNEVLDTTFYLDGERVGATSIKLNDAIKKDLQAITHIGNHPNNGQPFGKLAEVRIWKVALEADEVEINSKTVLQGDEPGLLAYYPMSEGNSESVQDVRNLAGQDAQVRGAVNWFPCAASIGNIGQQTLLFDGVNDFIDLGNPETLNFAGVITLSAWVSPSRTNGLQNIVSHGYRRNPDGEVALRILDGQYQVGSWDGAGYGVSAPMAPSDLGSWVHLTGVYDGTNWILYRNGEELARSPGSKGAIPVTANWAIGATGYGTERFFQGEIAEVSMWNRALSATEIKANMERSLSGTEAGLQGYWLLNRSNASSQVLDLTRNNNPGIVKGKDTAIDAVICTEYATYSLDPVNGQKTSLMRRFLGAISTKRNSTGTASSSVSLFSNQRIEQLELHWVGNAQFEPTLLGYIEGAPPIPSENLTVSYDYNGATSVELTVAEDVAYQWNREQDAGFGSTASLFIGVDQQLIDAVASGATIASTRAGFQGDLTLKGSFLNSSSVEASSTSTISDKLELRGTPELTPKFEHLGTRFIPKNIGYAVVTSGLADVYVTRLAGSKRMIGYQIQPVKGVDPDFNTITFLMNPAYTMNGSLDGMTGTQATSDRFFRHVPQMRNQYGSLYPASYYRLKEAYELKQAIAKQDKARETYFENFNSQLVDELHMGQQVDKVSEEKDDAQTASWKEKITSSEKMVHATSSRASWQKKMENIQIQAGKHNIVNTYVWDADGGLRTEAQQFASTVEHTIGGSVTFEGAIGGTGDFNVAGASAALTAQATFQMTQTMTKTERRSRGVALTVDLSGVEQIGITDYNDNPLVPGEKVDRYRFMSFYLEGNTQNFSDFFSHVVDPEWLQSNDEEARALRQVQLSGKQNPAWRVLHRVTYVERPALMGFGQDLRKPSADTTPTDTKRLLDRLNDLEAENEQLSKKLDQILETLQSRSASKGESIHSL